jgi:anthranilate synthase/aminodeoxychorismate synthase-like glutamine amidotransferase
MTARVVLIDNYDSFTYNLAQAFQALSARVIVRRNDAVSVAEIAALEPTHVCISPGPGRPEDAGISVELIRTLGGGIPTLGICLGHQAIVVAYGGRVVHAPVPVHGKSSALTHDGTGCFVGVPQDCVVGRYHSLVAHEAALPANLRVTARTTSGVVMGVRHQQFSVEGLQFHPESILTPEGSRMLANFLGNASHAVDVAGRG